MIYQFKITEEGYKGWFKAMEADGMEEAEVNESGSWSYCGDPRGFGSKIQDALDDLIEAICIRDDVDEIKYRWS